MSEISTQHPSIRYGPAMRSAGHTGQQIWTALIIWLAVTANLVVIVILWWRGGNVSGSNSASEWLNSMGRITGLVSAYLALVQVLLLARLPFLEHLIGFDKLTILHRLNARIVISLVVAHVAATTAGYALIDHFSVPREAAALLLNYPGMIAATIGTALFLLVLTTSVVIVRRHLRYESWYFVHLCAYAAIALAWFHQIPTGNEFITNPAAAAYWLSLYLITLALLIAFRIMQPAAGALRHRLSVELVTVEAPNVVSLYLVGRHLDKMGARAGQFFLWRFLTWNRFWESHPFSLSAAPDGHMLRITVKSAGDFTSRIAEIKPGTRVIAEGPFGVFTEAVRQRDKVLLIAGGIGITPIRALLEEMTGDLVLLYRVVSAKDAVFREELDQLSRTRRIRVCYVVGDHNASNSRHALSAEYLRTVVPDIADREVYLCGPPGMVVDLESDIRRAGVPRRYIHAERFAL